MADGGDPFRDLMSAAANLNMAAATAGGPQAAQPQQAEMGLMQSGSWIAPPGGGAIELPMTLPTPFPPARKVASAATVEASLEAALLAYKESSDALVRGMVDEYGAALGIPAAQASSAAPSPAWGHLDEAAVAAGIYSEARIRAPPSHRPPCVRPSSLGVVPHYRVQGPEMGHHAPSHGKGEGRGGLCGGGPSFPGLSPEPAEPFAAEPVPAGASPAQALDWTSSS